MTLNKQAQALGKLGGKKNAEKGKEYMKELGRKGAIARWGKKKSQEETKKA